LAGAMRRGEHRGRCRLQSMPTSSRPIRESAGQPFAAGGFSERRGGMRASSICQRWSLARGAEPIACFGWTSGARQERDFFLGAVRSSTGAWDAMASDDRHLTTGWRDMLVLVAGAPAVGLKQILEKPLVEQTKEQAARPRAPATTQTGAHGRGRPCLHRPGLGSSSGWIRPG